MTKILYMDSIDGNYIKEFDATVTKSKKDYICLDQTAFYPLGGGQPSDTGFLEWNNHKSEVKEVIKKGDTVKHILVGEKPPVSTKVHGVIDWDTRYSHMKMHTAQHIISGIVFDSYNARTVGNQIHADYSRVDFHPVTFSEKDLEGIVEKFNEIVSKNLPVKIYEEERESLEKRVDKQRAHLDLLPKFVTKLRIVEIEDFDICPCAGTHVRNTNEIPKIERIKRDTKGKDKDRIIYSFSK
jgi:misacylated tRNA(Ala) deacylase